MHKDLVFFQFQIDHYVDAANTDDIKPTILVSGIDHNHKPVRLHVKNFLPYLYVKAPDDDIKEALALHVNKKLQKGRLVSIAEKMKSDLYGYSSAPSKFYKMFFACHPSALNGAKQLFSDMFLAKRRYTLKVYESNIGYVMRFMIDKKIVGMSYLKVTKYEVCNGEYVCSFEDIEQLSLEGDFAKLPPFKILSFDIECVTVAGSGFPQARNDPVIQIGNTLYRAGAYQKDIFCLKETNLIPGANVFWFDDERAMLVAWRAYVLEADPDIITGFNIKNFDFPFLFERAEVLAIPDFSVLGRSNKAVKIREVTFSSKQMGGISSKELDIEGRLILDVYQIIKKEHPLRSYSLNNVSVHFLGEQKEDVPFYEIKKLQEGDKETRKRIASYCLKDTYLPLRLLDKLNIVASHTELSRVTGVPIDYITIRGQSIKMHSLILRKAKEMGYVCPTLEITDTESSYEGGYVMEPQKGFYANAIAVLDFSSLYPSIIISQNVCYTTMLTYNQAKEMPSDDYTETPTRNYFVKKGVKEGLVPLISNYMLENRKKVKKQMRETDDAELRKYLDARQNALKIAANSIYGFIGSTLGKLPCIEVSQSVTALGRNMIIETKRLIEEEYAKVDPECANLKVVYGDTDSVMISFGDSDIAEVYRVSQQISTYVTAMFAKPICLEFEKVYYPFLLINKKRYAGLVHQTGKVDTKGMEAVRRDNCELVRHIVETSLNYILLEKDVEKAKQFVKDTVRDLYMDRIDLSQLVISKSITKSESKYLAKQAHVELAERMRKRDSTNAPGLGERVAYVIVKGNKGMAAHERSEDPLYVLEKGLMIDKEYYIENQLSKPIARLFEPIMDDVETLLKGDHTRVHVAASANGPMSTFLRKNVVCLGCKAPGSVLCEKCRPDFLKHFLRTEKSVEKKKVTFSKCWVECQRCQRSLFNEVICVNRDCPIFYMRVKVMKDLGDEEEKLEKLRCLDW